MNTQLLANSQSWNNAPRTAALGFTKAMEQCQYGPQETADAWHWYMQGYKDGLERAHTLFTEAMKE